MFAANKTKNVNTGPKGGLILSTYNGAEFSFIVPSSVTTINALAIGGGGGGAYGPSNDVGGGGGGGALAFTNNISVTPNEVLLISAGTFGTSGTSGNGGPGGNSYIRRGATNLLLAAGGGAGGSAFPSSGGLAANSVGNVKFSGGDGYPTGGGGAGGYAGPGGSSSYAGTGGGGSGGSGGAAGWFQNPQDASQYRGGGTLPYGVTGVSGVGGPFNEAGRFGSVPATQETNYNVYHYDRNTGTFAGLYGGGGCGGRGGVGFPNSGTWGSYGFLRLLWNHETSIAAYVNPTAPSLVQSTFSATSSGTINLPNNILAGDLVLIIQLGISSTSTAPTLVQPAGFSTVQTSTYTESGRNHRVYVGQLTAMSSALSGTAISVMSASLDNKFAVLVFRHERGCHFFYYDSNNISQNSWFNLPANISQTFAKSASISQVYAKGVLFNIGMFSATSNGAFSALSWSGATFVETGIQSLKIGYKFHPVTTSTYSESPSATISSGLLTGLHLTGNLVS